MIQIKRVDRGFSLVEIALVLLVLGIMARAAILPLAAANDSRQRRLVDLQLDQIREAVMAFVVAYGALPCPLALDSNGAAARVDMNLNRDDPSVYGGEAKASGMGDCSESEGAVPAAVLGMTGAQDTHGALLDPWNRPYRYAVSLFSHAESGDPHLPDWTSAGEAARVGLSRLRADLEICGRVHGDGCAWRDVRANEIAFVLWSTGKDPSVTAGQQENLDGDSVFLWQEHSQVEGAVFDDHLTWVPAADVMYWMLRSGWLY